MLRTRIISLPSIEILESFHSFPCHFTFKVIGTADNNFTGRVIACVRDELGIDVDPPMSIRNTKNGKHVSISIEPECESAQKVIGIYSRLSGMDGVVMLL